MSSHHDRERSRRRRLLTDAILRAAFAGDVGELLNPGDVADALTAALALVVAGASYSDAAADAYADRLREQILEAQDHRDEVTELLQGFGVRFLHAN